MHITVLVLRWDCPWIFGTKLTQSCGIAAENPRIAKGKAAKIRLWGRSATPSANRKKITMKSKTVLAGVAAAIVTAGVVIPLPANAATATATTTTTCGAFRGTLENYNPAKKSNRVQATLDGTLVIDYRFPSSYTFVLFFDEKTPHVVTMKVTAKNGKRVNKTIKIKPCS